MSTIHIAQGPGAEDITVPQLFAGDVPAVATLDKHFPASQGAFAQYVPLSFDEADGLYKAWAPGDPISAITAYAIPDLAVPQRAALYTGGCFNIDAIAWPASTSEEQVDLACNIAGANSNITFRKLLYSGSRVLQTGLRVGAEAPPEVAD
jgi:hypothetical protein